MRLVDLVPATAYDAYKALGERPYRRLDRNTELEGGGGTRVRLRYRGNVLANYWQDGSVSIVPDNFDGHDYGALRRMAYALPHDWVIELRGRRLRPRLVFRGVLPRRLMNTCFLADGSVATGSDPRRAYYPLALAELHAEADSVEDTTPLPSRRRRPLPYPVRPRRARPVPAPSLAQFRAVYSAADARPPVVNGTPAPPAPATAEWYRRWIAEVERTTAILGEFIAPETEE